MTQTEVEWPAACGLFWVAWWQPSPSEDDLFLRPLP